MTREDYIKHITAEAEAKYVILPHHIIHNTHHPLVSLQQAHIAAKLSMWPVVEALMQIEAALRSGVMDDGSDDGDALRMVADHKGDYLTVLADMGREAAKTIRSLNLL